MSKIEVNTIDTQCGSALQIGDGNTATIGLGKSGDTITVPSGATIVNSGTATGFGREGTVDWITTPKVTGDSPITGVTGKGYFLNTTAGTITVNLPAGAAGSIVSMADYAGTWQTNNVTVAPNGSEKIGGIAEDATLSTEGQSVTFVYVDSTQGWLNTMDSTSNVRGVVPYVTATGGTPCSGAIVCTNYKVHTFTGPGTFCVTAGGAAAPCSGTGSNLVDYLVIAGGGGGADSTGAANAGAGAGGYRESPGTASGCYTVSPLGAAPAVALPVSVQGYPITVGGGGAAGPQALGGCNGNASNFSTVPSAGGGGGGVNAGKAGGSGGGAGRDSTLCGGAGNTPPTNPAQGTPGGDNAGPPYGGAAGGGGALVAGADPATGPGPAPAESGGNGGGGATSSIDATPTARAGGGGGGTYNNLPTNAQGTGGAGGGGAGGAGGGASPFVGGDGTTNTGSGGGGGVCGGAGGSGVVIIRYKFQN